MLNAKKDNRINQNDPNTQLMLQFSEGNEESFDLLFHNNSERAYQIAFRILESSEDAKDIVQEAFMRVYLSKTSWKPKARFITWFYRIIANLCFKHKRKGKNINIVSLDSPIQKDNGDVFFNLPANEQKGPAKILEHKEIKSIIQTSIKSLPEKQRIAVVLHRYENLSYKEISEVLECTIPAVESLLHRAKQTLRIRLEPYFKNSTQVSNEIRIKDIGG